MKKYELGIALMGLAAVLTGCGSQADCNSKEVQETYLDMVGNVEDQDALEILKSSVFEGVVTKDLDNDTGYRSCAAKIVLANEAGAREKNVSYQVERVESGDASFQVHADRNDLRSIASIANGLATLSRVKKRTAELADEAAENPFILATDQDARKAGIEIGKRFFGDRVDEPSVKSTSLDADGDGIMEFVTVMRVNYASGDSVWIAFASYQSPKGPGEKNSVAIVGDGAIAQFGVEPASYQMQGKSLTVTMVDGSKASLVYLASSDAYKFYIKANGGNPS